MYYVNEQGQKVAAGNEESYTSPPRNTPVIERFGEKKCSKWVYIVLIVLASLIGVGLIAWIILSRKKHVVKYK